MTNKRSAQALRDALEKRGITIEELAKAVRLNPRTIRNISAGAPSRAAQQKICDYLAVSIWPEIKPQTTETMIAESTVFLRLTREQAEKLHQKFPTTTRIVLTGDQNTQGCMVEFLADTPAIISLNNPGLPPPQGASRVRQPIRRFQRWVALAGLVKVQRALNFVSRSQLRFARSNG